MSAVRAGVWGLLVAAASWGGLAGRAAPQEGQGGAGYPFAFRDVAESSGLTKHLKGVRGHAAAWGDLDGDGWPDLWVGTYHTAGKPGQLLLNKKGTFTLSESARVSACASGAVFADLTNSGRLDLYVSNNAHGKEGVRARPSQLFRNDEGRLVDVSAKSGACPPGFLGRTATAADLDGDGLLDLVAAEFYYSPAAKKGLAAYRNKGRWQFEDVAAKVGLPTGSAHPGVAVADVNDDGWPDVFVTSADGGNRLYLNDGRGAFREAPGTRAVFAWKGLGREDAPAGVAIADVNRDGLPDIVVGHHFKAPWRSPAPVRLFLHRGVKAGVPAYEEVTAKAGLTPLAMKAPHVEVQDVDNDGWPDIVTSVVKFAGGKPCPVIYRNLGVKDGLPRFAEAGWNVNDFPTKADLAPRRTGDFFAKLLKDRKCLYAAAAPMADYDRDGRLDLLLVTWWEETAPLLLRNETKGGNWLQVTVAGRGPVNRMGVGAKVRIYPAGKLGQVKELLGVREVSVSQGWCSGTEAMVHFGLGGVAEVDLEVTLPHGKGRVVRKGVKVNTRLSVPMGD